jgi:hypothetical protein
METMYRSLSRSAPGLFLAPAILAASALVAARKVTSTALAAPLRLGLGRRPLRRGAVPPPVNPRGLRAIALLLAILGASTASAQLRYFGYHGGANDDAALARTQGYTNFAYIVAPERPSSLYVRERVKAMARHGVRAIIELEALLWCDPEGDGTVTTLCADWSARWAAWKRRNAAVLSRGNVLGFAPFDEPFLSGVDMKGYEAVCRAVKRDFPWAKLIMVEGACTVEGECNGQPVDAFGQYHGTLPGIDWVGIDAYGIHPASDAMYQDALARLSARFPDRKRIYVLDGFWDASHLAVAPQVEAMGALAVEWYDVARADQDAVLLGVFAWGPYPPGTITSSAMPESVLREQEAVGRAITGKRR